MSAVSNIKIETDRLKLRNMTLQDVSQDYVDWLNDPEISKYLSCANTVQTMESCLAYVQSYVGQNDKALISIFSKKNGLHIGNVTLSFDWNNKGGTVGISLGRKEYMGIGLASEALNNIVNYCFRELKLHRIQAWVSEKNLNSIKLFLNCGFKVEGYLRDKSLINREFQNSYILGILENE